MNRMDQEAWVDAIAQANANGWSSAELARRINKTPAAVTKACVTYGLTVKIDGRTGEEGAALADKLCRMERAIHRARLEVAALRERVSVLEAASE